MTARKSPAKRRAGQEKIVEFANTDSSISDEERLGISATTFLLLGTWLGPDRAVFLLTVIAIGVVWFWLCRRYPLVAGFTMGFLRGLFGR